MTSNLNGFPTDIGNILVRMGAISWVELHSAVERQKEVPHKKLGELLMENDFITKEILEEALDLQQKLKTPGEFPEDALVKLFNHAVTAYRRTNARIGDMMDGALAGGVK
jgi:hypothetical protein